ncbi:hypothetical protein EJ07DRAFT_159218 [Lizonia empirigonia]|nr:hypothetical protein EJ07DRAFT_159218 [Lizonia empirigonia]
MAVNWFALVGSEVARLRFSNPPSSSAGGVGGSSSSQDEICMVLSLVVENDGSGDVIMTTCAAVGVVEVACFTKIHHAVDRLWVEPMSGFSDNPIARPIRELETCLVIRSSKLQCNTPTFMMLQGVELFEFFNHHAMPVPPPKQRGSVDTSRTQRAAVITLRVVAEWTFERISSALGIPKSTCIGIVRRATDATKNEDINELLDYTARENNREVAGTASTKIWPYSAESVLIQDAAYWYPRETWHEAVRNYTPFGELDRTTIARICRLHPHPSRDQPLSRVLEVHKPPLSIDLMDLRVDYCRWCIFWLDKGALFVFTDETFIRAGGRPHKRQKVTVVQGQPTETRSQYLEPIHFSIMQWGAVCEDLRVPFPLLLWEMETPEEKAQHQLELDLENLTERQIGIYQGLRARQNDTIERTILSEISSNVELHNQARRAAGRTRGMKRAPSPQRIFKPTKLTRGVKTRGIDWFLYRKYVLHDRLFPYLRKLQELNPNRPIVVVEDNAPAHTKAAEICTAEYALRGIIKAPHQPNSPDLNQIDPLWDYEKDQLDGRFQRSSSKDAVLEGRALIQDEWARIGPKAHQFCQGFRGKLQQVIDMNGDNKYHG